MGLVGITSPIRFNPENLHDLLNLSETFKKM